MNTPAPAPTPAPTESLPAVSKAIGLVTTFHLVNVPPADARFISNLIAVFTDPKYEGWAQSLREGNGVVVYESGGGLDFIPLNPNPAKR